VLANLQINHLSKVACVF